ncbi:MAG TPA: nuclease domain-containing protein, partial [Saprospiraceae bacterium]|nr:nuclease domain-containing protein [Saprospiraceae bacterium]
DLFQSIFDIEPKDISDLIEATPDGLNLQIKQGKFTALCGVYDSGSRKLNVRFNYNRSFSGKQTYPESGSWTTTLRPDYTLSFWPHGISETEAEKQELIVHVHFDAKYKIANLADFLEQNNENDLDEEKAENRKGIYKNADLLKMHAYKDAIRRTGGAYVLYPGDKAINQKGFHEIIPGLGAFPVKPSRTDSGIGELKAFILEIIEHFINRASQREKIAYRTFDVYKNPPKSDNVVKEPLPEPYDNNRDLIPDDTFVLVGFYKSEAHLNWIKEKKLYNFRMDNARGALVLTKESLSSKYLLLHTSEDKSSGELWKIIGEGFRVISQEALKKLNYPSPSQRNYMIVKIEKVTDPEFKDVTWDFKNLSNFSTGRASAFPFTTSLTELMKNKIR